MLGGVTLDLFALQIVTGIALGSVYALLAIGLSLIFGMLNVVNFAHGAFFMVGAYVGFFLFGLTGNFWISLVITPLAVGCIGLVAREQALKKRLAYGRIIYLRNDLFHQLGKQETRAPQVPHFSRVGQGAIDGAYGDPEVSVFFYVSFHLLPRLL